MATAIWLDRIELASVRATDHTEWTFAEVVDRQGEHAVVELSGGRGTATASSLLAQFVDSLRGRPIAGEAGVPALLGLSTPIQADRSLAAAVSALRWAVVALQASHAGLSLAEALCGTSSESVPLYANVNRSLLGTSRTPEDFALAAERAVRQGFNVVKCAPFDEVGGGSSSRDSLEAMGSGIRRVAAVRDAVGPGVEVLVDCHGRFTADVAVAAAQELLKLDVGWFEEPLDPMGDVEPLQRVAREVTIPVAGGEMGYGKDFFAELMECGAVSIVMPDVMYCGGPAEAHRVGREAVGRGGQVSLHSPAGPASLLAGAHVTAAVPGAMHLEHAVNEAPWRAELLDPPERVEAGRLWFPDGAGLGATLDRRTVSRYGPRWRG